ncbi:hypothetical protein RYX36_006678 [Vicia faba]
MDITSTLTSTPLPTILTTSTTTLTKSSDDETVHPPYRYSVVVTTTQSKQSREKALAVKSQRETECKVEYRPSFSSRTFLTKPSTHDLRQ